jgi:hypothetical protein
VNHIRPSRATFVATFVATFSVCLTYSSPQNKKTLNPCKGRENYLRGATLFSRYSISTAIFFIRYIPPVMGDTLGFSNGALSGETYLQLFRSAAPRSIRFLQMYRLTPAPVL